jgi:hypothetical protein
MAGFADRRLGLGQKEFAHATPRPVGVDVEPIDAIGAERAEGGEPTAAAFGLGEEESLVTLRHRPDIALRF